MAPGWSHTPTLVTQLWLALSVPVVLWDTAYVLLRPHSMPGGRLHAPLFTPYALYGQIDHVYGWEAFRARSGFTGAQALLNLLESAMYAAYLRGTAGARGSGHGRRHQGNAVPLVVGFSAAVMTLSKTLLYTANEYCSGFDNVGHNPWDRLLLLYVLPNSLWLIFSIYMVYSMGSDILQGLSVAAGARRTKAQ